MQWDDSPKAGFSSGQPFTEFVQGNSGYQYLNVADQVADKTSLFHAISHMIDIRKQHHIFGRGNMEWVESDNPALAIYERKYQDERLLIIHNISDSLQRAALPEKYHARYIDLLSNAELNIGQLLSLQPYAYLWLKTK
jgi:glycosidase